MIVAEFCDLITKSSVKNQKGALQFSLGSYYNEFQIINYLGEDICALDHQNRVVIIKPQEGASVPRIDDRCIIIQYRFVSGPRQIGSMAIEQTQATHCKMTIPYGVLLDEPVFVEEINALLFCPLWHPHTNLHPHSKEYVTQEHDRLRSAIGRAVVYSPITIMANDPTGQIKDLYIELNGEICSVKVTSYDTDENEKDVVVLCIRKTKDDRKIIKTTFGKLLRENPICWIIEGFLISSDRVWLENKIAVEKLKPTATMIPVDEVKSLLDQAKAADGIIIDKLSETISLHEKDLKNLRYQYKTLKESYDDIVEGNYLDRKSDIAFQKIGLEEAKILSSAQTATIDKHIERMKLTKEQISTIATVAKTITVMIPLVVLYLKYKQSKTA